MDQSSNRGTASENLGAPSNSCPGVRRLRVDQQLWDLVSQPRTACVPPSLEEPQQIASKTPREANPVPRPCTKTSTEAKITMSELRCADDECDSNRSICKAAGQDKNKVGVACLFRQHYRSLSSKLTEIEEDTHIPVEGARQLHGV